MLSLKKRNEKEKTEEKGSKENNKDHKNKKQKERIGLTKTIETKKKNMKANIMKKS